MRLSYRQFRQLCGIERGLCRSDPHMAAMLAIFARLNAGEPIASREQARTPANPVRRCLAWLAGAIAGLAADLAVIARRVFRRAAYACAAARRQFSGAARASSVTRNPRDPRRPLGL